MNDFNRPWAAGLRKLIVHRLREHGPQTTHELATGCQVSPLAIAPRMVELEATGEAHDTGRRKSSASGKGRKQKVWGAARGHVSNNPKLETPDLAMPAEDDQAVMRLLA